MRKNCFSLRVAVHWDRLPRVLVESPCLETFNPQPERATCSR